MPTPRQHAKVSPTKSPKTIAAALIALDQMPGGDIKSADVIPHLGALTKHCGKPRGWVVRQHPDWGGESRTMASAAIEIAIDDIVGQHRRKRRRMPRWKICLSRLPCIRPCSNLLADAITQQGAANFVADTLRFA